MEENAKLTVSIPDSYNDESWENSFKWEGPYGKLGMAIGDMIISLCRSRPEHNLAMAINQIRDAEMFERLETPGIQELCDAAEKICAFWDKSDKDLNEFAKSQLTSNGQNG